ncbi:hypothetical protein ACLB2K_060683 [Fragaria x ananassa]
MYNCFAGLLTPTHVKYWPFPKLISEVTGVDKSLGRISVCMGSRSARFTPCKASWRFVLSELTWTESGEDQRLEVLVVGGVERLKGVEQESDE